MCILFHHRLKPRKVKNISRNSLGDKMGRVHVGKQDLNKIQGKRMSVLRDRSAGKSKRNSSDMSSDSAGHSNKRQRV